MKPFFSANFILTNAAGEYYGVRSIISFAAYTDFVQIGNERIAYDRLLLIKAINNILFVQFIDSNNKSIEGYLKYNPFLPFTASKKLNELVSVIDRLLPQKPSNQLNVSNVVLASESQTELDRSEVIIHSSKVSFPPICPACFNSASKVAKFEVASIVPSSDFLKIGFWLIPVCSLHKNITGHIKVKNWSPNCSQISFAFKNKLYAQAFLKLNQAPINKRNLNAGATNVSINKLRSFKYVIYEYYMSAIVFSFLQMSDIQELKNNESQFIRGLKYNAITFAAGWWSFPFGPIYTSIILFKNLLGGNDVTNRVIAVYQGEPFSALED